MRKKRFAERKIIGFLKGTGAGMHRSRSCVERSGSVMQCSTAGARSSKACR